MPETKIDDWLKKKGTSSSSRGTLVEQEKSKKKRPSVELLKEEHIGDVKVVLRKNEKLKYLEIRAYDLGPKKTIESRGFAQYLPLWKNEFVDGPKLAHEYFDALVAWFKGGRQGNILPFRYSEGPWHEEGA